MPTSLSKLGRARTDPPPGPQKLLIDVLHLVFAAGLLTPCRIRCLRRTSLDVLYHVSVAIQSFYERMPALYLAFEIRFAKIVDRKRFLSVSELLTMSMSPRAQERNIAVERVLRTSVQRLLIRGVWQDVYESTEPTVVMSKIVLRSVELSATRRQYDSYRGLLGYMRLHNAIATAGLDGGCYVCGGYAAWTNELLRGHATTWTPSDLDLYVTDAHAVRKVRAAIDQMIQSLVPDAKSKVRSIGAYQSLRPVGVRCLRVGLDTLSPSFECTPESIEAAKAFIDATLANGDTILGSHSVDIVDVKYIDYGNVSSLLMPGKGRVPGPLGQGINMFVCPLLSINVVTIASRGPVAPSVTDVLSGFDLDVCGYGYEVGPIYSLRGIEMQLSGAAQLRTEADEHEPPRFTSSSFSMPTRFDHTKNPRARVLRCIERQLARYKKWNERRLRSPPAIVPLPNPQAAPAPPAAVGIEVD